MSTLALLAALLLLAVQAQAEPLRARSEETPDQEQPRQDNQVASISFSGDENSAQDVGVRAGLVCYCRTSTCELLEHTVGSCYFNGITYRLCCR